MNQNRSDPRALAPWKSHKAGVTILLKFLRHCGFVNRAEREFPAKKRVAASKTANIKVAGLSPGTDCILVKILENIAEYPDVGLFDYQNYGRYFYRVRS